MSLTRIALRMAAVEALRGRTQVGDRVLDSEIGAIVAQPDGSLRSGQETRFVAVYTQDGEVTPEDNVARGLYDNGVVELIFETGITTTMLVPDPETGNMEVMEGIPGTDSAFEFYLDLVGRQILDALLRSDGAWPAIWQSLVLRVAKIETLRTDDPGRVRLAGRQIKLTCEVIADPLFGAPVDAEAPFGQFLGALEASGDPLMQARATLIRAVLEEGTLPTGEEIRRRLGLTADELARLGIGALATDDGLAGVAASATIVSDGRTDRTVE